MLQTMPLRQLTTCAGTFLGGLLATMLASLLVACGSGSDAPGSTTADTTAAGDPRPDRAKPLVVCTTGIVGDLVRTVAGEHAEVVVLIAPGTDPHLWNPTRSNVLRILEADAVFMNGLLLEGRAGDAFARVETSGRPVVRLAESIDRKDLLTDTANSSHFDPHVWMDPTLWARTAPAVATALAKASPDHAKDFEAGAARVATEAEALDREIRIELSAIPVGQRTLVTAHDAFGYFGRRYDLEVRGVQGISTESEPSLAAIEALVAEMSEKSIPAIFAETTVSDRSVRAIVDGCGARGHEVRVGESLYSDSLGPAASDGATWAGMLRHNARAIAAGLGGRR
jgi:manganese/zinc/iron transport system substrate-binding protein